MGSQPWKTTTLDRWEDRYSGKPVVVANPGTVYGRDDVPVKPKPERVEGLFVGHGSWRGRPCIYVHTRPEMHVREPGYFDHEVAVILERGMSVEARDAA